jgi:hypothetical protein
MGKPGGGNAPSPAPERIGCEEGTRGNDTSEYPEEKKESLDSLSSGERKGNSPNRLRESLRALCKRGCRAGRGRAAARPKESQTAWVAERAGKPGRRGLEPRRRNPGGSLGRFLSKSGYVKPGLNLRGPPRKAKY